MKRGLNTTVINGTITELLFSAPSIDALDGLGLLYLAVFINNILFK
jgi:hypothetical protein